MKMRVWWIPQVNCKPFNVEVNSVQDGVKVMDILAKYDDFQFENNIKPDYCNCGGISILDTNDTTDGKDGSWVDWCDEETGEDDPRIFVDRLLHVDR